MEYTPIPDHGLTSMASLLDDIEHTRMANAARLDILTRPTDVADADGICRGSGYPIDHPAVFPLAALDVELVKVEEQTIKALQKQMKTHPLAAWQEASPGVGAKQLARLLAETGDPYLHSYKNEDGTTAHKPRTVSQLWAYCGLHTLPMVENPTGEPGDHVAARRKKGVQANWRTGAKTRAYLIANSCLKRPAGTVYRDVYNARREATAERIHVNPCQVCAGKGKPAEDAIGKPWRDGHKHADALRVLSKRILKDMWREARDFHNAEAK